MLVRIDVTGVTSPQMCLSSPASKFGIEFLEEEIATVAPSNASLPSHPFPYISNSRFIDHQTLLYTKICAWLLPQLFAESLSDSSSLLSTYSIPSEVARKMLCNIQRTVNQLGHRI